MKKKMRGAKKKKPEASPSRLIDDRVKKLGDWRGETLARIRTLIRQADPDVVEEVKWRKPSNAMLGVPVWEHDGIICTGETYKAAVKMTFARGASLDDPSGLFNASLEGNTRRAIDFHEGDKIDAKALKALVRAAVAKNTSTKKRPDLNERPRRPKPSGAELTHPDTNLSIVLPATANLADISVDIFPHDAAMTPVGVTVVVGVTAITGAIVAIVIAITRTNADSDADRTRADPHTLSVCRHRHCDARRSQDSDCKFSHWNLLGCCTDGNARILGTFL